MKTIAKIIIKKILFVLSFKKEFREYMAPYFNKRPLNEDDAKKMARCCDLIESLGLTYRLTDGTALGLYRNGEFIAHDDDVDIDILDPTSDDIKRIKARFCDMKVVREVYYRGKIQQLAYYDDDSYVFDIVFWYKDGNKVLNYCERDFERTQDAKFFERNTLTKHEFLGRFYPMASDIENWLVSRYGEDWNIPKTYKGDWKEECQDIKRMTN
ncbi:MULTISPECIES: LicD family protein [Vibrio]|uniref:LicD family protein n=1 Tax=Vibrio TaxID=662 RepID=UPI001493725F|nr:LicD family protein [Vibrio sp. RE88]NOH63925.1 hypothetical protein [Vibrio sp. RE88]